MNVRFNTRRRSREMRNGNMWMGRITACLLAFGLLALPGPVAAAEMGHGGMKGMKTEDHGGMMKMGDKVFSGKVGPWTGEARLMDMKAHMEKAKASGMRMEGMKSHHISFELIDPGSRKPVTDGKGTVTVTGPDKKAETTNFMVMEGHLGADVHLPKPGRYTFRTEIESGGKKGSATFSHTVR
jgi:hypothetical protein